MKSPAKHAWLDDIKWTKEGLVPAIAQDAVTGRVLMFAWMNRESLVLTVQTQEAVYFSRSRNKLWHKGEESGHIQKIKSIRVDCDNDVILLAVDQLGDIACHTGRQSCFFKELKNGEWQSVDAIIKDPGDIYK